MIRIEEVRDRNALDALAKPWAELVAAAPGADIFHTREWLGSWLDCFWEDRPIAFLFAWEGERLVGLAPLVDDRNGDVSCGKALALPVNSHTRRQDVVCAGDAAAVLEAMLAHLRATGRRVRLTLRQTLEDSPAARALPDVAARLRLGTMQTASPECPIVRIDGSWDAYLASRPGQVARELKRKLRKLERDHRAEWSVVTAPSDCAAALEDVWRIEQRSWKEGEGTSLAAEAEAVALYRTVVPRFAEAGWLRLHLLKLDGAPAAHILGAELKGEYFALKTSYDASFKAASPGQVIFFHALRDAFERRLTAFDFLGHDSRWKRELSNATRRHVNVCAHAKLDAGCAWHTLYETQLKPLAQAHAPKLVALGRRLREGPAKPPAPVPAPVAPTPAVEEPVRKAS